MFRLARTCFALVASLGLVAFVGAQTPLRKSDGVLHVYAAASLVDFLKPIASSYERAYPEIKVRFTWAGSDVLATQLLGGKQADVLLTADELSMSRVVSSGLVSPQEQVLFATNSLVLVTTKPISNLEALRDPLEFKRIMIANPQNSPAGRYARDALTFAGVWKGLQGRVVYAPDVRKVVEFFNQADIDAAVVYRSDVSALKENRFHVTNLSAAASIRYFVAPLRAAPERAHALRFVQLVRSDPARGFLQQYQFLPVN
jgi:molybdate transport system substrate-binding protein